MCKNGSGKSSESETGGLHSVHTLPGQNQSGETTATSATTTTDKINIQAMSTTTIETTTVNKLIVSKATGQTTFIDMIYSSDTTSSMRTTTTVSQKPDPKNDDMRMPLFDMFLVVVVALMKVILSFSICFCCISQTKTYKIWKTTCMTRIALNILEDQRIRDAIRYNEFVTSETVSMENNPKENNLEVFFIYSYFAFLISIAILGLE